MKLRFMKSCATTALAGASLLAVVGVSSAHGAVEPVNCPPGSYGDDQMERTCPLTDEEIARYLSPPLVVFSSPTATAWDVTTGLIDPAARAEDVTGLAMIAVILGVTVGAPAIAYALRNGGEG